MKIIVQIDYNSIKRAAERILGSREIDVHYTGLIPDYLQGKIVIYQLAVPMEGPPEYDFMVN